MEYVKSAGASNVEGPTDQLFKEGLNYYWDQYYSSAIPKFEAVKRLFPQHSEVDRLVQSSQQAKAEGRERAAFPMWLIIAIVAVLLIIGFLLLLGIIGFIIVRKRRSGKKAIEAPRGHGTPPLAAAPSAHQPSHSPSPVHQSSPPPPAHMPPTPPPPMAPPRVAAEDQGMTVDLSRTVAITADASVDYGSIRFVSGPLSGREFEIKPDGEFIGRDSSTAQIVVADPRISKKHLWIGVKDGQVVIVDQDSRNGTFINDPKSARVTHSVLTTGDVVIMGESDVARFEYKK
jgi:hypothetical protein